MPYKKMPKNLQKTHIFIIFATVFDCKRQRLDTTNNEILLI